MSVELGAAAKILSKPINDLYELGKEKFKSELLKSKTTANINKIYKSIFSIQKVKTIWQIDKAVSLKSFYYPSSIIINNKKTNISSISKIPSNDNIVIQGMVGQGKSIFLRYLTYQEAQSGAKLPIFFELRRIEKQDTLKTHLLKILDSYGFNPTDEMFDFLCSSGKISLLLDGFDEVVIEKASSIITEIELLSEKYQNLKIVISSRPDSGIEKSPYFEVFKLAPLEEQEIPLLLNKIMDNKEQSTEIHKAIKTSGTNIRELLKTPLMVTLLVLVYKSEQKIPEQLSEFYENLFPLLLYRHDKSKPGYVRARATQLNERKLQQVFDAFCFHTRKKGLSTISNEEMHAGAEDAFKSTQTNCDSSDFIKDITKVSNLIIEEGHKYHFIHKSIQEYHAASYIKSRPDEAAIRYYTSMAAGNYHHWTQEIKFLSQIDSYRYTKYLLIPSTLRFFTKYSIPVDHWSDVERQVTAKILTDLKFMLEENTESFDEIYYNFGKVGCEFATTQIALDLLEKILDVGDIGFSKINKIKRNQALRILKLYKEKATERERETERADSQNQGTIEIPLYYYFEKVNLLEKCNETINTCIKELHSEINNKIAFTRHEENSLSI